MTTTMTTREATTIRTHRTFGECEVRARPTDVGPMRLSIVVSSDRAEVPRAFITDGELVEGVAVLGHSAVAVNLAFLGSGLGPRGHDGHAAVTAGVTALRFEARPQLCCEGRTRRLRLINAEVQVPGLRGSVFGQGACRRS